MGQLQTLWIFFLISQRAEDTKAAGESLEPPLHLGDPRHKLDPWCMKNAYARPGRHAARGPGCSCFRNKGNDIHGIPQQRKCGSSLLRKLHSTASSETTQTHCGHSTLICGFPTRGLAHIYQPFSQGAPTSFSLHNLWEASNGKSESPPPSSLVWLRNPAGRLSQTGHFSSHPLNFTKFKHSTAMYVLSAQFHQPYCCSLAPAMRSFHAASQDGGCSMAAGITETMTNEEGVKRDSTNKQLCAFEYGLKTSDLSLCLCFYSLPSQQKIKFAVNMSWWKEFKWYFE